MADTPFLDSYTDKFWFMFEVYNAPDKPTSWDAIGTVWRNNNCAITVTVSRSSPCSALGRCEMLMRSVMRDYLIGQQQLPPDGDASIEYHSPTST